MTNDTMFEVTNFVGDVTKIVFTSAKGIPFFSVHAYSEAVLKANKNNSHQMFHTVKNGVHKDEIKPFIKYVKVSGIALELFETGGPGFTPVMDICGLLAYTMRVSDNEVAKHVREMAENSLLNFIVGDPKYIENARANGSLSAPIQELIRKTMVQQRACSGPSIAAPADQVLAARGVLLLHLT